MQLKRRFHTKVLPHQKRRSLKAHPSSQEAHEMNWTGTPGVYEPHSWEALGTTVVLRLTDSLSATRARELAERELDAIDRACSRFRPDSELSLVNARAGRSIEVSLLLIEALQVALRAAEHTNGDVDPTLGRALVLAGYDRDWKLIAKAKATEQHKSLPPGSRVIARSLRGWGTIELDLERRFIRVPPGIALDLGATAKAWVADRIAENIHIELACGVLVNLGGDIATAGEAPPGGWCIHVTDDHRSGPDAPGQTVSIRSGGLATSSVTTRRWSCDGVEMHHIIDPATGAPVRGWWRTASVAAENCTDANIAATAALIRGEQAVDWLASLGLPARLVTHDGAAYEIAGWPPIGEPQKRNAA
jgi:thiamine biosynthesis lipoprotein ApbE